MNEDSQIIEIMKPSLLDSLKLEYNRSKSFSLDVVYNKLEKDIVRKVINGGLTYTSLKKRIINGVLDALEDRERKIISLYFGLEDGQKRTLKEVGKHFNLTGARIRQIFEASIRKLQNPIRSRKLSILSRRLVTDSEIKKCLTDEKELCKEFIKNNIKSQSVDILEFNNRISRVFKRANIRTIEELIMISPGELLRYRQIGYASLEEIQIKLRKYNLKLGNKG